MRCRPTDCLFTFLVLAATGCVSVKTDLATEHALLLRSLDEAGAVAKEGRAPAVLAFDQAVSVMLHHNPALRQARLGRVNAERDARRVWERLIPYFSLRAARYSNFNQRELRDFSATQFAGDVAFYLRQYAELPNDLYAVALAKTRADIAWRMAVKFHLLDLYGRCKALAGAQDAAARAHALDELMGRHPGYFRGRDRDDARAGARDAAERVRGAEDALRDLLGVPHETVRVELASLPAWAEAGEELLAAGLPQEGNAAFLTDPDWVALMAVEGAGAIARRRGILRGYWPSLDGYLTLPNANYDSRNGLSRLDLAQTQINVNMYWSPNWILDTQDQSERAKDEEKLMREAFERNIDGRFRLMATQARLLREAAVREADLGARIAAVRKMGGKLAAKDMAQLLERSLRWQVERDEVRHQRSIGLAQLWFLSDNNQEVLSRGMLE